MVELIDRAGTNIVVLQGLYTVHIQLEPWDGTIARMWRLVCIDDK